MSLVSGVKIAEAGIKAASAFGTNIAKAEELLPEAARRVAKLTGTASRNAVEGLKPLGFA